MSLFTCTNCDSQFPKWYGRCPECSQWGTLVEQSNPASNSKSSKQKTSHKAIASLSIQQNQKIKDQASFRLRTQNTEVDRVLGGGIVPGSLLLLSGEPGRGKSTLAAMLACSLFKSSSHVLYISGEESLIQLKERFLRLSLAFDQVHYLEAHPIETIIATIEKELPTFVIIDSIQTIGSQVLEAPLASPNLVRYITNLLLTFTKQTNIPILLIGQVTKEGSLAGPKTLEHLVDVVLSLEGDSVHALRFLRSSKNRFGSTGEVGVFEMTNHGLIALENPSKHFLQERVAVPGSVLTATLEGSRVFLVEVQALVEKNAYSVPIRRASGFDQNRLMMLCAILSKRASLSLQDHDVYINVVGGIELHEPASDLAVCAAILSAKTNKIQEYPVIYLGEVGLGGELRSVPLLEQRVKECKRFGIKEIIVPMRQKLPQTKGITQISELSS
ncbi:DNA repair protein RadA [Candidatus Uhrbacteria bacterium CG_4_9_14_3_um_filter_36_7]|uniref:DNA repair protein RadA n=1 Tax=Candidatus Uhrbacteria bacterium CG_4_9_14_3_um_filter_36_7 TaxID=1975033 RepID=A0A2M7XH09_9BACT|nr:MAG: DNA repair protein RadA [Candidatus Uhrbacteria bacterium CG_4_9_14_3_um_filter_36_7]